MSEMSKETAQQALCEAKRAIAHKKLREAESAWYAYFAECEVGPRRTGASEVYERLRRVTSAY